MLEAEAKRALLVGLNSATGRRGLEYDYLSGNQDSGRILKVDSEEACVGRCDRHAGGKGRSENRTGSRWETIGAAESGFVRGRRNLKHVSNASVAGPYLYVAATARPALQSLSEITVHHSLVRIAAFQVANIVQRDIDRSGASGLPEEVEIGIRLRCAGWNGAGQRVDREYPRAVDGRDP